VYVIIYSIDAPSLRTRDEQELLSQLAASPKVCLVASSEHINAPALFDAKQNTSFKWLWHHMPTMMHLWQETVGYESVLADASAQETQGSATVVLSMLTPTSRLVCFCPPGTPALHVARRHGN
jgi:origin recognition complex subunit 2